MAFEDLLDDTAIEDPSDRVRSGAVRPAHRPIAEPEVQRVITKYGHADTVRLDRAAHYSALVPRTNWYRRVADSPSTSDHRALAQADAGPAPHRVVETGRGCQHARAVGG